MLFIISLVSHISIKNTKANSLCDLGDPAVLENQGIQRDPLPLGVPTCPSFLCDPSCREPQGYPECPDHQQVLCLLLFHYHPTRTRNTVSSDLIWEAHMWMDGLKDGPTPFLLYVLCLLVFLTCPKIKIKYMFSWKIMEKCWYNINEPSLTCLPSGPIGPDGPWGKNTSVNIDKQTEKTLHIHLGLSAFSFYRFTRLVCTSIKA